MTDRPLPPAVTGTDARLDAILAELRGLRADLERAPVAVRRRVDRLADDVAALAGEPATVELREPDGGAAEPREPQAPKRRRRG